MRLAPLSGNQVNRAKLKHRILVGVWVAFAVLAASSTTSVLAIRDLRESANSALRARVVVEQLRAVLTSTIDVETGMRGFALTGAEASLEPYHAARRRLPGQLAELHELVGDNPAQQRRLPVLDSAIARRLLLAEGRVLRRQMAGNSVLRDSAAWAAGKAAQDTIRATIAEMEAEQATLLRERERRAEKTSRRALWIILLGAFASLTTAVTLGWVIRRGFAALRSAEASLLMANDELLVATEQARRADRVKSAFLATMSHELRTPLNSIIGFTGILLEGLPGPLNPEQAKQMGMVQDSARHLLALINDVLDISKIEAGELAVYREPFDVRASVTKLIGVATPLAEQKGLALHERIAPDLGQAIGDQRRTEQVLLNLLSNAIKFSERGVVTLTVEQTPDVVRFQVTDTGIGIKPEDLPTVFDPFRQVDSGLSRAHEGTGLGLAICRRLAGLMGGEIHAESTWGHGSTFTFTLPRYAPVQS